MNNLRQPISNQLSLGIHLGFIVFTSILLLSGLRIAADNHRFYDGLSKISFADSLLPSNEVFWLHIVSGFGLLLCVIGYFYRYLSKFKFDISPNASSANKLINHIGIVLIVCQCVTGVVNIFAKHAPLQTIALNLHTFFAITIGLYFVVHLFFKLQSYGPAALKVFKPSVIPLAVCFFGLGLFYLAQNSQPTKWFYQAELKAKSTINPPVIDGNLNDAVWEKASEVIVTLQHLNNYKESSVSLEIKSAHDTHFVYFAVRWPDPEPSYMHIPLRKSRAQSHKADNSSSEPVGEWTPMEDGFSSANEIKYYEDKLAIMFANSAITALKSIHLGSKPIIGAQRPLHNRGYHFLNDGIADVWQWKAWRTDSLFQADDNYFGKPATNYACDKRYTAGYQQDPSRGGGYTYNWNFYDPQSLVPKRLPKGGNYTTTERLNSNSSEFLNLRGMRWVDTLAYESALDTFSEGTLMASHMTTGPITGDRGNVKAKGHWHEGYWHLEFQRLKDTSSAYDLPLQSGVFIWLSSFNHSQTHHSYHIRPLKLRLIDSD